jgi:hypothetical protein
MFIEPQSKNTVDIIDRQGTGAQRFSTLIIPKWQTITANATAKLSGDGTVFVLAITFRNRHTEISLSCQCSTTTDNSKNASFRLIKM